MSSNLKRVIHLKAAQKKMEMLKGWNKLNKVKKREDAIHNQREHLVKQYASLNDEDTLFQSAELNELALDQASYFAMSINSIDEEKVFLKEKRRKLDNDVNMASALSEAYETIGEEVRERVEADKAKSALEMEMSEATERSYGHAHRK
ncbi:hypothetical protein [Enterovibrio norvegicus]|uniref:Flagellar FliJ protein n=1 Tax=Enterovibrio norvegicus TaxID=188144 RepID=A0ABV4L4D3_9GAMM|nr:hypothetical protein [Enterovibrio norvegicus]OEF55557.1 hypothetical protein A1OU_24690 [Enterovibrio norvegicus]